ncbi:MAG: hypothetical protein AB8B82_13570 [Roseovarius sp.]
MRRPVVIAVLAIVMVALILIWRSATPVDPVGLSNVNAQPVMGETGVVHVGLTVETGAAADVLVAVSSPAAQEAVIVSPLNLTALTFPAMGAPALSEDGSYIKLTGVEGEISDGRLIPIQLTFLRSGEMSVRARVGADPDPHAKHRAMAAMADMADDGPVPVLNMTLEPAANDATLVRLEVENFTFAPDSATPEHVPGHGHGHLYLNGLKLQRMYDTEALIGALPPGSYNVRVDLNSNLHVAYQNEDGPVSAEATLVVE